MMAKEVSDYYQIQNVRNVKLDNENDEDGEVMFTDVDKHFTSLKTDVAVAESDYYAALNE